MQRAARAGGVEEEGTADGARTFELVAQLGLAQVLIAFDGADAMAEIEASLARAGELTEEIGAMLYEPLLHEERARLGELTGDTESREHELRTAQRQFETIGAGARAASLAIELTPGAGLRSEN